MQAILAKIATEILERHNYKENKVKLIDIWDYEQNSVIYPEDKRRVTKVSKRRFKPGFRKKIQSIQFTTSWRNHYIRYEPDKEIVVYISPYKGTTYIHSKSEFDKEVLEVILPLLQL